MLKKVSYFYQVTNLINRATGISYKGVTSTVVAHQFDAGTAPTTVNLENPANNATVTVSCANLPTLTYIHRIGTTGVTLSTYPPPPSTPTTAEAT